MKMNSKKHIQAVQSWLDENVVVYATPKAIEISGFQLGPNTYRGSFQVALDGVNIPEQFSFGLGSNGKPELYIPMFHSPLGAPASYARVELGDETVLAIKNLLASVLPEMKSLGFNRNTGEMIFRTTHSDSDRIVNQAAYEECMGHISRHEFSASSLVSCVSVR